MVPISVQRCEPVGLNEILKSVLPTLCVCVQVPVEASQILTVLSSDADATSVESGENATELTELLCPLSVCVQVPVAASQILTVLLCDADATSVESGENAAEVTVSLCPLSVCVQVPVAASQILTVLSSDADATSLESGENATEVTQSLCPSSVCRHALQSSSTAGPVVIHLGSSCLNSFLVTLRAGLNTSAETYT